MGDVQKLFNPDHFRVKFRAGLAILGMLIGLVVILLLLLNETAQESTQADFIAGFVLATMIAGIMAYYFGNRIRFGYFNDHEFYNAISTRFNHIGNNFSNR